VRSVDVTMNILGEGGKESGVNSLAFLRLQGQSFDFDVSFFEFA